MHKVGIPLLQDLIAADVLLKDDGRRDGQVQLENGAELLPQSGQGGIIFCGTESRK